jgi:integrase
MTGEAVLTVDDVLPRYQGYLEEKGNKPRSIKGTVGRVRRFFSDGEVLLRSLTTARCREYYKKLCGELAVDTHRNALAEAKTFLDWCRRERIILTNPAEPIKGVGRRRKGKPQLRIDEARKWLAKAVELAKQGEAGAVAAMCCFLMALRASEVVERQVRDLDDGGRLLWIPDSKTEAGKRTVEVPEVLRPLLLALCDGKGPEERLFGQHWRDWPRKWTQRICKLAEVPVVTAHGMRGPRHPCRGWWPQPWVTSHRPPPTSTTPTAKLWTKHSSTGCSKC